METKFKRICKVGTREMVKDFGAVTALPEELIQFLHSYGGSQPTFTQFPGAPVSPL